MRNLHNPGNKTQLSSPKKVTGASGSEEQPLAKQIARAVHHHAVGRAFHLLVAFFSPPLSNCTHKSWEGKNLNTQLH